ncbi:MAG: alpha-hydroxy acid oxidase [Actinomycetes bacterium]
MASRQFPRLSDITPLIGFKSPFSKQSDVDKAVTIWQLRAIAQAKTPRAVFDYTDGAAGEELSMNRSREVYRDLEFYPRVLRDVATVDTSVTVLGQRSELPFFFSPTGFTRMMHYEGEPAVAQVAVEFGIPYTLSTLGTTSIEDLAAASPDTRKWFQLYLWRDKASRFELVGRAAAAGYEAIMLTVDTVVGGMRVRDVRNGLTIPPQLSAKTLADMARYPKWWGNLLTTAPLEFASLKSTGGTVADLMNSVFDPSITMDDVKWLRENWHGKLIIKGVQNVADAQMLIDAGVDALVLSNHGGRQLDRSVVPLELLPQVRAALGSKPDVMIDGGALCGADIVAGIALGATGVMVGRAYLYGIMAGGLAGVRRAATILKIEVEQTMRLMGIKQLDELEPDSVRLRHK